MADESETISTRTLALTRYRRNHEFMNEVFMYAAFGECVLVETSRTFTNIFIAGDKKATPPPPPFSIFKLSDLEEKGVRIMPTLRHIRNVF